MFFLFNEFQMTSYESESIQAILRCCCSFVDFEWNAVIESSLFNWKWCVCRQAKRVNFCVTFLLHVQNKWTCKKHNHAVAWFYITWSKDFVRESLIISDEINFTIVFHKNCNFFCAKSAFLWLWFWFLSFKSLLMAR